MSFGCVLWMCHCKLLLSSYSQVTVVLTIYFVSQQEDVTFDNLYRAGDGQVNFDAPTELDANHHRSATSVSSGEPVYAGARGDRLLFDDCHVSEAKERSFTITNHSEVDTVRFQVTV